MTLLAKSCDAFKTHPSIAVSPACYNYPPTICEEPKKLSDRIKQAAEFQTTIDLATKLIPSDSWPRPRQDE